MSCQVFWRFSCLGHRILPPGFHGFLKLYNVVQCCATEWLKPWCVQKVAAQVYVSPSAQKMARTALTQVSYVFKVAFTNSLCGMAGSLLLHFGWIIHHRFFTTRRNLESTSCKPTPVTSVFANDQTSWDPLELEIAYAGACAIPQAGIGGTLHVTNPCKELQDKKVQPEVIQMENFGSAGTNLIDAGQCNILSMLTNDNQSFSPQKEFDMVTLHLRRKTQIPWTAQLASSSSPRPQKSLLLARRCHWWTVWCNSYWPWHQKKHCTQLFGRPSCMRCMLWTNILSSTKNHGFLMLQWVSWRVWTLNIIIIIQTYVLPPEQLIKRISSANGAQNIWWRPRRPVAPSAANKQFYLQPDPRACSLTAICPDNSSHFPFGACWWAHQLVRDSTDS